MGCNWCWPTQMVDQKINNISKLPGEFGFNQQNELIIILER